MGVMQDDGRAAAILRRRASGLLALDETLTELADADCADALAAVVAERMRLRQELVMRALAAESDEVISVMCAAAGFRVNSYSALLRMRRRQSASARRACAPTEALKPSSDLSRMTRAAAEKLLRHAWAIPRTLLVGKAR